MINDFALELKVARRKSGLTQSDCAHLMGKSTSRVCQLEKGRCSPGLKEICTLSLIYGKSFESLFGAIFSDICEELSEAITTLPYPAEETPGSFNRRATLDRIAQDLAARLKTDDRF